MGGQGREVFRDWEEHAAVLNFIVGFFEMIHWEVVNGGFSTLIEYQLAGFIEIGWVDIKESYLRLFDIFHSFDWVFEVVLCKQSLQLF